MAHKFHGPGLAIASDYSASIRSARKHLIECAKGVGTPSKLRFYKLFTDRKSFVFDTVAGAVKEINQ